MIEALKSDEIVHKLGGRFKLCALVQHRMVELIQGARPLVERQGRGLVMPGDRIDRLRVDVLRAEIQGEPVDRRTEDGPDARCPSNGEGQAHREGPDEAGGLVPDL